MENIEFIRGLLEAIGDTTIDLSPHAVQGDYTIFLNKDGHVCRYWSCAANEQVDLDEGDDDDDIPFIMYALQTELIETINHYKNLLQ